MHGDNAQLYWQLDLQTENMTLLSNNETGTEDFLPLPDSRYIYLFHSFKE